jgi:proliferating cell nuclear antigen
MKLTAKTEIIKEFIGIADGISALELRLHIEEDAVRFLCVDTANVALASAVLPIDAFTEHTFEPCIMCIDVTKFKACFGYGGKEISITRDTLESNMIVVESGGYRSTQTLLHDATVRKDPNMPALELPGIVELSEKEFSNIIKVISAESDKLRFIIADNKFKIKTENEGPDNTEKELLEDEVLHIGGDGNSMFSKDYLVGMIRQLSGDINVHLGFDHPIVIDFKFAGGHGNAKYLLAPRIEA